MLVSFIYNYNFTAMYEYNFTEVYQSSQNASQSQDTCNQKLANIKKISDEDNFIISYFNDLNDENLFKLNFTKGSLPFKFLRFLIKMTFEATKYSMKFLSRMAYCIASSKHDKSVAIINNTIDLNRFSIQIVEQLRSSINPSPMLDDRAKRDIFFLLKMVVCALLSLHEISNKKGALYEGVLFIVGNDLENFSFLIHVLF